MVAAFIIFVIAISILFYSLLTYFISFLLSWSFDIYQLNWLQSFVVGFIVWVLDIMRGKKVK